MNHTPLGLLLIFGFLSLAIGLGGLWWLAQ